MTGRHAITIGVPAFRGAPADEPLEPLPFARDLVGELAGELRNAGYETVSSTDGELAGDALGAAVVSRLDAADEDGVALVHVLSHGHCADGGGTVYVLGADGVPTSHTSVGHWLQALQDVKGSPHTLFLLDLCSAGIGARLPWQTATKELNRGWVIAACRADGVAYDGRFTRAVINVLRALHHRELDIDPTLEHVPLATVARAIRQEVNRLALEADGYPQQVTASLVDLSTDPELPFFRNPAYSNRASRPGDRTQLRSQLEPGLLPFLDDLDEGLDARHFVDRATGTGSLDGDSGELVGCFTGRDRELRALSPWLNGVGTGSLCVVTGSPGVGKSALLGVMVCAAHPALRGATKPIWDRVAQAPLPIDVLAAVHARGRSVGAVVASLGRQFGVDEVASADELLRVLAGRSGPVPVVVLDALDEADAPTRLMRELLLPLSRIARPSGIAAVRLMVGVRRYDDFRPLLDAANYDGQLVDLDDVPLRVLEDDLHRYVMDLLRTAVEYRTRGGVSGAFAGEVARVLAVPDDESGTRRWGPFLVAGLYTRHIIRTRAQQPVSDPAEAEELGRNVPRALPAVLELDLAAQPDQPWLRPVLTALACAYGQGMPMAVLRRVAAALAPDLPPPGAADIRGALHAGKFYLRQSTDTDHTSVYRLFHQGLVDDLDERRTQATTLLTALLTPLGPPDARDWAAAEPYLLRHVLDHAADAGHVDEIVGDPGFLLLPSTGPLLAARAARGDETLRLIASVRDASLAALDGPDHVAPATLALNAVRSGLHRLAARLGSRPGAPPLAWRPLWVFGEPLPEPPEPPAPPAVEPDPGFQEMPLKSRAEGPVRGLVFSETGQELAAYGNDRVQWWSLPNPVPGGAKVTDPESVAISADGRLVVCGSQGGTVSLCDTANGQVKIRNLKVANVLAVALMPDRRAFLSVTIEGLVLRGDLEPGSLFQVLKVNFRAAGAAVSPNVVVCWNLDVRARAWSLSDGQEIASWVHDSRVAAAATSDDGRLIVSGADDGGLYFWFAGRGRMYRGPKGVTALAVTPDGEYAVVGYRDGAVRVMAHNGTVLDTLTIGPAGVTSVAVGPGARRVAAGSRHGDVTVWSRAEPAAADTGPRDLPGAVTAMRVTPAQSPWPGAVVVADNIGDVQVLDVATGDRLAMPIGDSVGINSLVRDPVDRIRFVRPAQEMRVLLQHVSGSATLLDVKSNKAVDVGPRPTDGGDDSWRAVLALDDEVLEATIVDGQASLRILPDGIPVPITAGHAGPVNDVACGWLAGSPVMYTAGQDGTVRVWDVKRSKPLDHLPVGSPVRAIEPTHDGHLLVRTAGEVIAWRHASVAR